jgi:NACHT N-terminal Helical domain 1
LDRRPTHRRGEQEGAERAAHAEVPARSSGAAVPHEAASELASFGRNEFRGLDDGERAAALLAVGDAFERADLTDRTLFAVDVDAAKLASRRRAGRPRAKTDAGLSEAGGAFYDAALDRCCELYVRAVVQVPTFVGRSLAEMLNRLSDLPDQVAARVAKAWREAEAAVADPDGGLTVAGRPLEEVTDPFALEVYRPVQPAGAHPRHASVADIRAARAR